MAGLIMCHLLVIVAYTHNCENPSLMLKVLSCKTIDILYTLDSASNYSAIQKLKP